MSRPVFSCPQVGAQAVDITALIDREVLDAVSAFRGDYVDVPMLLAVQQITLMREMLTELRAIREALAPVAGAGEER